MKEAESLMQGSWINDGESIYTVNLSVGNRDFVP